MFRLVSLKIYEHSFLGTIKDGLSFIPPQEIEEANCPYSTVIIGPNGTGKSSIMAIIAEIFEDIKRKKDKTKSKSKLNYKYEIKYFLNENEYLIAYNFKFDAKNRRKIEEYTIVANENNPIKTSDLEIPERIIAVSYLTMDRFRAKKNEKNDFYMYLGLRDRSNAARARTFINNSLPLLFDFIQEEGSISFLKEVLSFLGLNQDYLGISFEYRYKKAFYTGELDSSTFINLFETYSSFTGRTETPYGVKYFDSNIRGNSKLINQLVNFINIRTYQDAIEIGKKSYFEINLLDNKEVLSDLQLITHLRRLDLMSTASFMFKKGVQLPFDADEASSGEFHFLTTMIAIQSAIKQNSIVLIDEPEISFHPNWQMKYLHTLKNIFKKWNSSHLIITSHSHFLVSDLEGSSSEVIGLSGAVPNVKASPVLKSTYGWTAEQVLLEVFKIGTTRNFFFINVVDKILKKIASKDFDRTEITKEIMELSQFNIENLDESDPIKIVVKKLKDKVTNIN